MLLLKRPNTPELRLNGWDKLVSVREDPFTFSFAGYNMTACGAEIPGFFASIRNMWPSINIRDCESLPLGESWGQDWLFYINCRLSREMKHLNIFPDVTMCFHSDQHIHVLSSSIRALWVGPLAYLFQIPLASAEFWIQGVLPPFGAFCAQPSRQPSLKKNSGRE